MVAQPTKPCRDSCRVRATAEAMAIICRVAQRAGVSRKAALTMIVDAYEFGPSARARNTVRGQCNAIALNARMERRTCVGGSERAKRMEAIEKAANEIPAMLEEGDDGARVGQVMIIPRPPRPSPESR